LPSNLRPTTRVVTSSHLTKMAIASFDPP